MPRRSRRASRRRSTRSTWRRVEHQWRRDVEADEEMRAMMSRSELAVLALLATTLAGCDQGPSFAATTDALTLERKIPLGDVAGRIEHLAFDLEHRRLFVAELGNNTVGVVDVVEGKVLHRISGLKEPQGVGYVQSADTIYAANAGDGSLHTYRGSDFSPLGTLKLGDDADNTRVDASANKVIVGYGKGALPILDAA